MWRSIETAPLYERVLVVTEAGGIFIDIQISPYGKKYWMNGDFGQTHWMPLPDLPEIE